MEREIHSDARLIILPDGTKRVLSDGHTYTMVPLPGNFELGYVKDWQEKNDKQLKLLRRKNGKG